MIYISNPNFFHMFIRIKKYLTYEPNLRETHGGLIIDEQFMIAARKTKMRPLGQIDWSWYTAKTLATAMNEGAVLEYYERMLVDPRSDHNRWKNKDEEMTKKAYYAARSGMAELI